MSATIGIMTQRIALRLFPWLIACAAGYLIGLLAIKVL